MTALSVQLLPSADSLKKSLRGLTPRDRAKLLKSMGAVVLEGSKKRIQASQNLDGSSWTPRKKGKKKMLRRSGRLLKVTRATADAVALGYASPVQAAISLNKHDGLTETYTVKRGGALSKRSARAVGRGKPATAAQAKELLKLGFEVREPGHWEKTPKGRVYIKGARQNVDASWIRSRLSRSQAGAILRSLRGDKRKTSWEIPNVPRTFLGASASELAQLDQLATTAFAKTFTGSTS